MPKVDVAPAKPVTKTNGNGKPPKAAKINPRPIIYATISAYLAIGEQSLTAAKAKEILGWQELDPATTDYLLIDENGKKIRCTNNGGNRPFYAGNAADLKQEILMRHWQFNFTNIVIGKTGQVLNGQHRLIALILAVQTWENHTEMFPQWTTEPTIETSIGYGVEETDDVCNTQDTGKRRTSADAIYRSPYFESVKNPDDRKTCSTICEHAIKWIWSRTGKAGALAPRATHSEILDFLNRHPTVVKCVKHVFEENKKSNAVGHYISAGYGAGILFLMCCSKSDRKTYVVEPSDRKLNFDNQKLAFTFFVDLAAGSTKMVAVKEARLKMMQLNRNTAREQCALVVRAWNAYTTGKPITASDLVLKYEPNDDGVPTLIGCPTVGGIDLGNAKDAEDAEGEDPTPEQIQQRSNQLKAANEAKKNGKSKKQPLAVIGSTVWVAEDGGHFTGKVTEIYATAQGQVAKILMGNKKTTEAPLADCLTADPNDKVPF